MFESEMERSISNLILMILKFVGKILEFESFTLKPYICVL